MEKINIAEILEDCPKGAELYSPVCGKCNFSFIQFADSIIKVSNKTGVYSFAKDGTYTRAIDAECLLFPSKDNRDWSTFRKPFKDGDILTSGSDGCKGNPFIFKQINSFGNAECYCAINCFGELIFNSDNWTSIKGCKLATPKDKEKLFDAIKENGYNWNPETKTLEKLPEPKFKVGDEIVKRNSISNSWIVSSVSSEYYGLKSSNGIEGIGVLPVSEQDDYDLLINTDKFYINTLIPFESRVLVRDNKLQKWSPAMWGYYDFDSQDYPYKLVGGCARYCIPYEKNEHLLGTTNDCDNFFKTW